MSSVSRGEDNADRTNSSSSDVLMMSRRVVGIKQETVELKDSLFILLLVDTKCMWFSGLQ